MIAGAIVRRLSRRCQQAFCGSGDRAPNIRNIGRSGARRHRV